MDSALNLDLDIKKKRNKEVVGAVFIDIEKPCDVLWKEGLQELQVECLFFFIRQINRQSWKLII